MYFTEEQKKEFSEKWCNVWILCKNGKSAQCFLSGKVKFLEDRISFITSDGSVSFLSYDPICGIYLMNREESNELDAELFDTLFGEKIGKNSS